MKTFTVYGHGVLRRIKAESKAAARIQFLKQLKRAIGMKFLPSASSLSVLADGEKLPVRKPEDISHVCPGCGKDALAAPAVRILGELWHVNCGKAYLSRAYKIKGQKKNPRRKV